MRGRKPRPIEIAPDDLPLLQQIAHSQIRPWYQVRRARILLGIAHGARTQILAFLTQCDESTYVAPAAVTNTWDYLASWTHPRGRDVRL